MPARVGHLLAHPSPRVLTMLPSCVFFGEGSKIGSSPNEHIWQGCHGCRERQCDEVQVETEVWVHVIVLQRCQQGTCGERPGLKAREPRANEIWGTC